LDNNNSKEMKKRVVSGFSDLSSQLAATTISDQPNNTEENSRAASAPVSAPVSASAYPAGFSLNAREQASLNAFGRSNPSTVRAPVNRTPVVNQLRSLPSRNSATVNNNQRGNQLRPSSSSSSSSSSLVLSPGELFIPRIKYTKEYIAAVEGRKQKMFKLREKLTGDDKSSFNYTDGHSKRLKSSKGNGDFLSKLKEFKAKTDSGLGFIQVKSEDM